MTKSNMNIVKSAAGGAAAGLMMGFLSSKMSAGKKDIKKKAGKAMESLSDAIDTVAYMFK